jgi:hypothetical protein
MEPQTLNVRDGFRVLKTAFVVPQEVSQLDSQAKRRTTICNLFINHRLSISDIARVLDETSTSCLNKELLKIAAVFPEQQRNLPLDLDLVPDSRNNPVPDFPASLHRQSHCSWVLSISFS